MASCKTQLARFRHSHTMLAGYFSEFIWRRRYSNKKSNPFKIFLEHVALVYNPTRNPTFRYARTQDGNEYPDDAENEAEETHEAEAQNSLTVGGITIHFQDDDFLEDDLPEDDDEEELGIQI